MKTYLTTALLVACNAPALALLLAVCAPLKEATPTAVETFDLDTTDANLVLSWEVDRTEANKSWPVTANSGGLLCGLCQKQGTTSRVYTQGCLRTLMATYSYYDENGEFVFEDPNTTSCNHTCSNGHWFFTRSE